MTGHPPIKSPIQRKRPRDADRDEPDSPATEKRQRREDSAVESISPSQSNFPAHPEPPTHPLTVQNLRAWTEMSSQQSSATLNPTPTPSGASETSGPAFAPMDTRSLTSNEILEMHRIWQDRFDEREMPQKLEELKKEMLKVREGEITPKSKGGAWAWKYTRTMQEVDAQAALEDVLGYPGEYERVIEEGEKHIYRTRNRLWNTGCVPIPAVDSPKAELIFERAGIPKTPKPDITYGYTSRSFTEKQHDTINTLNTDCRVLSGEPFFPYWIVEWKSQQTGANLAQAETQARRDGAAAVNAMHQLFVQAGIDPSPHRTAIFTASVDSETIRLRMHWRNETKDGDRAVVNYESERLSTGLLSDPDSMFRIRSHIVNILHWARETRLPDIQSTLNTYEGSFIKRANRSPTRSPPKKNRGKSNPTSSSAPSTASQPAGLGPAPAIPPPVFPQLSGPYAHPVPQPSFAPSGEAPYGSSYAFAPTQQAGYAGQTPIPPGAQYAQYAQPPQFPSPGQWQGYPAQPVQWQVPQVAQQPGVQESWQPGPAWRQDEPGHKRPRREQ